MQHKSKTERSFFPQNICDVNQTLFLLPSGLCYFDVKKVFRKSKMSATKTLTYTNRILRKDCYQYTKQPHLSTIGQSYSISMPDDNFKYLAM